MGQEAGKKIVRNECPGNSSRGYVHRTDRLKPQPPEVEALAGLCILGKRSPPGDGTGGAGLLECAEL